ncbi:MAG: hypothetical protein K5769_07105 [Pseudobutyrivibrio sp.]|nr:hypothetical protein [Pseudobutyrivibrio sp.]
MNVFAKPVMVASLLTDLYEKAFEIFKIFLSLMQFPALAGDGAGAAADANQKDWHDVWDVAKTCFDALKGITIPVATIFFIIAIYKSVISKPGEEQPKQFLLEAIRFVIILFITENLFTILSLITEFSEQLTSAVLAENGGNKVEKSTFWDDGIKVILAAISNNEKEGNPKFSDLINGDILVFCEKIFTFLVYFLGGLVTLLTFVSSGYTIVMATVQRIVKPIIMMPFSTIVIGIGAASSEGERMIWHYAKSFLGYCLSGVFILMAVKMGLSLAGLDLFNLPGVVPEPKEEGEFVMSAIVALFRVNLPVLITAGLVKSADSFMDKIFA